MNDEWVMMPKGGKNGSPFAGHEEKPCVSVTDAGFTFSKKFCEMFDIKKGTPILVFLNNKTASVGFRKAKDSSEVELAYTARSLYKGKVPPPYSSCAMSCDKFRKEKLTTCSSVRFTKPPRTGKSSQSNWTRHCDQKH